MIADDLERRRQAARQLMADPQPLAAALCSAIQMCWIGATREDGQRLFKGPRSICVKRGRVICASSAGVRVLMFCPTRSDALIALDWASAWAVFSPNEPWPIGCDGDFRRGYTEAAAPSRSPALGHVPRDI
jgi:hypothetical protein